MAIFIKQLFVSFCLVFPLFSLGHTIYAPNDSPLLDNRFRIDPEAEQVTFIFNHSKGAQRVVLIRPDGSKLFEQQHANNVAWTSSKTQNIVTIQQPMAGPWQAVATLDGDNRIKIMSKVQLKVNRLPLKLYAQEYITTDAALYDGETLLTNPAYLADARLSVSLIGDGDKKLALYQDDGRRYDELAFDGKLTARLYVDLLPARYLLSIRTKNEVFIRNVNKDAVVFPSPITYKASNIKTQADQVKLTFAIDEQEIDPTSVVIEGAIKDTRNEMLEQVIINNINSNATNKLTYITQPLPYDTHTFSGKAYATTHDGREIELQLAKRFFELTAPIVIPEVTLNESSNEVTAITDDEASSATNNIWIIIGIVVILLIITAAGALWFLKRHKREQQIDEVVVDEINLDELSLDEFNLDELHPPQMDEKDNK